MPSSVMRKESSSIGRYRLSSRAASLIASYAVRPRMTFVFSVELPYSEAGGTKYQNRLMTLVLDDEQFGARLEHDLVCREERALMDHS